MVGKAILVIALPRQLRSVTIKMQSIAQRRAEADKKTRRGPSESSPPTRSRDSQIFQRRRAISAHLNLMSRGPLSLLARADDSMTSIFFTFNSSEKGRG